MWVPRTVEQLTDRLSSATAEAVHTLPRESNRVRAVNLAHEIHRRLWAHLQVLRQQNGRPIDREAVREPMRRLAELIWSGVTAPPVDEAARDGVLRNIDAEIQNITSQVGTSSRAGNRAHVWNVAVTITMILVVAGVVAAAVQAFVAGQAGLQSLAAWHGLYAGLSCWLPYLLGRQWFRDSLLWVTQDRDFHGLTEDFTPVASAMPQGWETDARTHMQHIQDIAGVHRHVTAAELRQSVQHPMEPVFQAPRCEFQGLQNFHANVAEAAVAAAGDVTMFASTAHEHAQYGYAIAAASILLHVIVASLCIIDFRHFRGRSNPQRTRRPDFLETLNANTKEKVKKLLKKR